MSRIFYKPRLKRVVIGNRKFTPNKKGSFTLKRLKWKFVDLEATKNINFFRNDCLVICNQVVDLRKQYKFRNTARKIFFSYFSTLKNKELKRYFLEKKKQRNCKQHVDSFYRLLEHRLDFILVKANFAKTVFQARWLVGNGFVLVNKRKIVSLSFSLKLGDLVKICLDNNLIKKDSQLNPFMITFCQPFLEICYETFSFVVLQPSKKMGIYIYPHFFNLDEIVSFFHK